MWDVRYWAAEALEPTRRGRTLPREGDRMLRLRPLIVVDANELVFVTVRGISGRRWVLTRSSTSSGAT